MATPYIKAQALDKAKGRMPISTGQGLSTLRQPVALIKKRSGPLDGMIDELHRIEKEEECVSKLKDSKDQCFERTMLRERERGEGKPSTSAELKHLSAPSGSETLSLTPSTSLWAGAVIASVSELATASPSAMTSTSASGAASRRRLHSKEKEKKRERWLLTRKTWRYMTDAGRKLLPEGKSHGAESIGQIEAQFQRVCASEPRFILWRRKSSFPGATKSSRKRLRILPQHRGNIHARNQELIESVDLTIELLQSYLNIRDSYKTTTLLGTKTIRPDQTSSPSSQRPVYRAGEAGSGPKDNCDTVLLERLKSLERMPLGGVQIDNISAAILEDKVLLRKIYNALKKQQLHRILHSTEPMKANLGRSTSFSSLYENVSNESFNFHKTTLNCVMSKRDVPPVLSDTNTMKLVQRHPGTLDLVHSTQTLGRTNAFHTGHNATNRNHDSVHRQPIRKKLVSLNSCGTQTSFIQLSELKFLAEQYEQMLESTNVVSENEEAEKGQSNHRRSSIDNEDVSQSVSDTIKRYLRMARKKSLHDGDANRFKSVNYDRNLRNIKAKGEINPPGMDDGNSKAVQTLDAWAQVALDYIRGNENSQNLQNAHIAWQKDLDERIRKKIEWEKKMSEGQSPAAQNEKMADRNCISTPTSPTTPTHQHAKEKTGRTASAILTTGSNFLSNFWHPNSSEPSSTQSLKYGNLNDVFINSKNETTNMQKSKSLSNVGQFVSRKIWGSRSKCQSRQNQSEDFISLRKKWTPQENYSWISEDGQMLQLTDTSLEKLSDIESEFLRQIALEKIKELNIGLNINFERKSQKSRIISKKRAATTSFFDIGKKDEHNGKGSLFGTSLESCLSRDNKTHGEVGLETGSKNPLAVVFRSSLLGKSNDNVRSYESLPTKSDYGRCSPSDHINPSRYPTNLQKSTSMSMEISRSQFDIRNVDLDLEPTFFPELQKSCTLNVPNFITTCIEYLEEHGLQKVGLFRVSTSQKRVKQLREEFDKNCNMRIPDNTCPHDVATLLKEFLRDLPEPLLCRKLYSTFLETQRIRNRRLQLEAISHLIKLLPIAHRDTLFVLLKFLGNVAAHCDDICSHDGMLQMSGNRMDSNNLSTVFAPNLLRDFVPKTAELKEQGNMTDAINVIRIMIDHCEEIFRVPVELLDLIYSHMLETCPDQLHSLIASKVNQFPSNQNKRSRSIENQTSLKREEGSYKSSPLPDGRRQSTPIVLENQNVFSASLQISKAADNSAKGNTIEENKVQASFSEPKLPTSISNIGGATLSAKTSEFERNASKSEMPASKAKPLYKRQQIISSFKR